MSSAQAPVYEAIAAELTRQGIGDMFGVLGHGNMRVVNAWCQRSGRFHLARHEGNAMVMADSYARVSGRVGACTVTQGPGLGNAFSSLVTARRARSPVLMLAGQIETGPQAIDQDSIFAAAGVPVAPLSAGSAREDIAAAFRLSQRERTPVGINMPMPLLERATCMDEPSLATPLSAPAPVDAAGVGHAVELIRNARRPVVLAGRGAVWAHAADQISALAQEIGALLVTTYLAKGFFHDDPWEIGISGGFSSALARELLASADCLIAFGASFDPLTLDGGELYDPATSVVRCDVAPDALEPASPCYAPLCADARVAATALLEGLRRGPRPGFGWRDPALRRRLDAWDPVAELDPADPGSGLDPRRVVLAIEHVLPRDRVLVAAGGHCQGWPAMYMSVPDARSLVSPFEFGAVGGGLGAAVGAAVARPDVLTVCVLGDGDLLMGLADLDSALRFGTRLLVIVLNDGAYGSEVNAMRDLGIDPSLARYVTPDFAALARACGGDGMTIGRLEDVNELGRRASALDGLLVADCRISGEVRAEWDQRLQVRTLRALASAA